MDDKVEVVIIGDETGTNEAFGCMKYKEIVSRAIVWTEDLFYTEQPGFIDGYDIYIVAFKDCDDMSKVMRTYISDVTGVLADCVLDFYLIKSNSGPTMLADRLVPAREGNIDTIIMGLSHAEAGLISKRFGENAINLAISSQDLWSNNKVFQHCLKKYPEKINCVKNFVLDMYDYSYFNFDTSMSKNYGAYLYQGGYALEPHNFHKNQVFTWSFDELQDALLKKRRENLTDEQMEIWNMIGEFKKYDIDTPAFDYRRLIHRNKVVSEKDVDDFYIGAFAKKEFSETINENLAALREMLDSLYIINSKMKVLLVTIPRYVGVASKEAPMIEKWKDYFYRVIDELKGEYPLEYADYTSTALSEDRSLYYDAAHFNVRGAMVFTDMVKELLS